MFTGGQTVAVVKVPSAKLARDTAELVREPTIGLVCHHSRRLFWFGGSQGRNQGLSFDPNCSTSQRSSTTPACTSNSIAAAGASRWTPPAKPAASCRPRRARGRSPKASRPSRKRRPGAIRPRRPARQRRGHHRELALAGVGAWPLRLLNQPEAPGRGPQHCRPAGNRATVSVMNAPDAGADMGHAADAGAGRDLPGQARLPQGCR
jgi:hypothetical protein